jgi:hypothetical protein
MSLKLIAAFAAVSLSAAVHAMPVQTFLTKADALQKKGPLALLSGDYKLLTKTVQADAKALRDERVAAKAAGRTPAYCPPGPVKMSSRDIVDAMRAVPGPSRVSTDTKKALRAYFARRFPCRG